MPETAIDRRNGPFIFRHGHASPGSTEAPPNPRGVKNSPGVRLIEWHCKATAEGKIVAYSESWVFDRSIERRSSSPPGTLIPFSEMRLPEPAIPSQLPWPISWDPKTPHHLLPCKEYTDTSPKCASLGAIPSHSESKHRLLDSPLFTLIIRFVGTFARNGRQPGLFLQAKHFKIRVLSRGYVAGEKKIEIWKNGERVQMNGLIAVFADGCEWGLGDDKLKWCKKGRARGREEVKRLKEAVGLGKKGKS